MKSALTILFLIAAQSVAGQSEPIARSPAIAFFNGHKLMEVCNAPAVPLLAECYLYLSGNFESLCGNVTVEQVRVAVIVWAHSHRDQWDFPAAHIVHSALAERWPCPKRPS